MNERLRRLAAAALVAIAPVGLLVTWLVVRDDLPTRLATHFGLNGVPDGFQRVGVLMAWALPLTAALAAVGVAVVALRRLPGGDIVAGILSFLAWMFAAVCADILLSARGVVDPQAIRSGWAHTVVVILLGSAAGLLVWWLLPSVRVGLEQRPTPAIALNPSDRVVWLSSAQSRPAGLAAAALLVAGLVLLVAAWVAGGEAGAVLAIVGGSVLPVGLAVGWCRSVVVRVGNDGVTARLGGVPWPTFRTPLESIEQASATQIEPMQWGGWGYRISRRGTAIVIRRGPGIVLCRAGRTDLAITVDDAETGASVVNGLVAARSTLG